MPSLSKGAAGEVLAARFLRDNGYELLAANYRCRLGEIDIIASDGAYIIFVEVKTRQPDARYLPREAVTADKQQRIRATAMLYLQHHPSELMLRFDVIEITATAEQPLVAQEIRHLKNAF